VPDGLPRSVRAFSDTLLDEGTNPDRRVGPILCRVTRMFSRSSRSRLTRHDLGRFPGATLFDRVARAVCAAGCLPRKELYESWEMAKRVRRHVRGARIVDVCGGHGLLAHLLLVLDRSSPAAVVVDKGCRHRPPRFTRA
jgi:hypothetical protein